MKKIFLTPSNQPENLYAYGNTNEQVQCGYIAEACKKALERCGFEVKVAHKVSLSEKISQSNDWGADLHIPIHTNAFNGSVSGTRIMCYSASGKGYEASKVIFKHLAELSPGTSENITTSKLAEVVQTKAPCVYIEVDFHDVPTVAKWIIEHTTEIGETICKGVCEYFGVSYKAPGTSESDSETIYRVQVGAFRNKANAENLVKKLKTYGFSDAFIVKR